MNISPDNVWDIIKNVKYEDINNLCRTNRQFAQACQTPQAQSLFRSLQLAHQERKRIEQLLNQLEINNISFHDLLLKSESPLFNEIAFPLIDQFDEEYPNIGINRIRSIILSGYDPEFTGQADPVIDQLIYQVNKAFLLEHPYMLPTLQLRLSNILRNANKTLGTLG